MDTQKEWIWLRRFFLIILVLLTIYLLILIKPVWSTVFLVLGKVTLPFLLAAIIAYLLHPIIESLQQRHIPRPIAILGVYVLFFGGGAILIWYYSPAIYYQLTRFMEQLPAYFHQWHLFYSELHHRIDHLPVALHDRIENIFFTTEQYLTSQTDQLIYKWRQFVDFIVLLLLLPFLVFYLLKDIKAIEKLVKKLTPKQWHDEGELLAKATDQALGDYIRGQVIVAGSVGGLSAIALWLIGMEHAFLLGAFIAVMDVIPYIGPIIGAIPAIMVASTISTSKVILTLIILFVIQQVEGNFLSPYVVGRTVNLHPLVVVFALLLGFETAGFIGLLLSVPLFVVINNIYHTFKKEQQ